MKNEVVGKGWKRIYLFRLAFMFSFLIVKIIRIRRMTRNITFSSTYNLKNHSSYLLT